MDALFLSRAAQSGAVAGADRSRHRELPIEATYIGRTVQTTMNEVIEVKLMEVDNIDKVLLMEKVSERVH